MGVENESGRVKSSHYFCTHGWHLDVWGDNKEPLSEDGHDCGLSYTYWIHQKVGLIESAYRASRRGLSSWPAALFTLSQEQEEKVQVLQAQLQSVLALTTHWFPPLSLTEHVAVGFGPEESRLHATPRVSDWTVIFTPHPLFSFLATLLMCLPHAANRLSRPFEATSSSSRETLGGPCCQLQ